MFHQSADVFAPANGFTAFLKLGRRLLPVDPSFGSPAASARFRDPIDFMAPGLKCFFFSMRPLTSLPRRHPLQQQGVCGHRRYIVLRPTVNTLPRLLFRSRKARSGRRRRIHAGRGIPSFHVSYTIPHFFTDPVSSSDGRCAETSLCGMPRPRAEMVGGGGPPPKPHSWPWHDDENYYPVHQEVQAAHVELSSSNTCHHDRLRWGPLMPRR